MIGQREASRAEYSMLYKIKQVLYECLYQLINCVDCFEIGIRHIMVSIE